LTDVLVQMPVSDALSAAMTEVLYAGNLVIAGSWLPYGILRRHGINYTEVTDFSELPKTLEFLIQNLDKSKLEITDNTSNIQKFLSIERTSREWISLFNNTASA